MHPPSRRRPPVPRSSAPRSRPPAPAVAPARLQPSLVPHFRPTPTDTSDSFRGSRRTPLGATARSEAIRRDDLTLFVLLWALRRRPASGREWLLALAVESQKDALRR